MVTYTKKKILQPIAPSISPEQSILLKDLHMLLSQLTVKYKAHQSDNDAASVKIKAIMSIVSTAIVQYLVDKDLKRLQEATQKACSLMTAENKFHPDLELVHEIHNKVKR